MTLTEFEPNTLKDVPEPEEPRPPDSFEPPPPDTAEFAAQRILEGILSEEPEVYAHDWMKK